MTVAATYQLKSLPSGFNGTKKTLSEMGRYVKAYKTSPAIFELSRQLTRHLPQKDWYGEIKAVHNFVRDKIRYIKDVRGVETLQSPNQTLRLGSGDCDDKSTLVATLLSAMGHPVRFVAAGPRPNVFLHVYPETKIGNKWIPLETTEPWECGEMRQKMSNQYRFHVK